MYILGLDTTQAACSAAIYDSKREVICARVWRDMTRGHAEALPGIINQTLELAELSFKDIDKLATTIGPGTFTGVRVGLSAARGFALALELPLVGITSLEAIAAGVDGFDKKMILAAFDARRDEVYAQLFENGLPSSPACLVSPAEAATLGGQSSLEVVGTASDVLAELNDQLTISQALPLPDSAIVANLASHRPAQTIVQPLYLRRADAKAQKPLLNIEPQSLKLVTADAAHAEVFSEIHKQGFSAPWSTDSFIECLNSPGTSGFLATNGKDDQQPLGFVVYRDGAGEREILTLAVRLDARRRSVASFLLGAVLNNAENSQIDNIFLEVSENNFAAQNLYEKLAFSKCGLRKKYYTENDGQKYDAVLMKRGI